jgi:hypothetical protein
MKKKMQNVSFKTIDEFLEYLPEDELAIVQFLREMILDSIPEAKEKLTYNVPYYSGKKRICFVWPGAVFWGSKRTYEGVRLGFVHGHLMHDDIDYLEKEGRKSVYYKTFTSVDEIDKDILSAYLMDAVMIDEQW